MKSPASRVRHVREALGTGLVAIIDVRMSDPPFMSMNKNCLRCPAAAAAVRAAVTASVLSDSGRSWYTRKAIDKRLHVTR